MTVTNGEYRYICVSFVNFDVAPGFYTPEALEDEARNWIAVVRYNYNLGIVSDFIIKKLGI